MKKAKRILITSVIEESIVLRFSVNMTRAENRGRDVSNLFEESRGTILRGPGEGDFLTANSSPTNELESESRK